MDKKLYKEVKELMDYINDNGGRSYCRIDELKETKELDKLIEQNNIHEKLKNEIELFIKTLYDPYLDMCPLTRKIYLYRSSIIEIFGLYSYEIGSYFDDPESYHILHRFLKSGIKKYNITLNINLNDLEERLNYFLDTTTGINPNRKREEQNIKGQVKLNEENYKKYENINNINYNNKDMFFVWSETDTYNKEKQQLKQYQEFELKPIWVSKTDGDGFGFDILSYDFINQKEKAIEVKSGKNKEFTLSEPEYNTIQKLKQNVYYNHVDYYVYKYTYDETIGKEIIDIYKYDFEKDILININTNETATLKKQKNEEGKIGYRSVIEKQKTFKKTL